MLPTRQRRGTKRPFEPPEQRPIFQDPRNFALVVEKYQALLFRHVFNMVRDHHQAEDLTQEIFAKAFWSLASYNPRYPFSAWLLRIGHNHGIDYIRRRRVPTHLYGGVPTEEVRNEEATAFQAEAIRRTEDSAKRSLVQEAIYSLPVEHRSVITLRYLAGVRLEEIAYILDIPVGTVKSRISRARAMLQQALAGWRGDLERG